MHKSHAAVILFTLFFFSCSHTEPRQALLDNFFRDYIERADAKAATQWSTGAAKQKLDLEAAQVAGQPRPMELPKITYTTFSTQQGNDSTTYDLMLKIEEKDAPSFSRELLITEANADGGLKVVDFQFVN